MINAIKNKNGILRMLAVIVGVIVVGALVYVFGLASLFARGNADRALSAGEVKITSVGDLDNYFIFLPAERVQTILQESEDKFLFPQISLAMTDGTPLTIREQQVTLEDQSLNFVAISGLSSGTKLYTVGGFIRGGIVPRDDGKPYAWIKEGWDEENNHNVMLTYFSLPNVGIIDNPGLNITIHEGMSIYVGRDIHYGTLLTETSLPEDIIPGGANIAVAIAGDDGVFTKLSLRNILTYKGRIVMVERQP